MITEDWTFKSYTNQNGTDVIKEWINSQEKGAQAVIIGRLRYFQAVNITAWERPFFDKLSEHIHEIRVQWDRIEYRILGFFGPDRKEFTMVYSFIKKTQKVSRADIKSAEARRKEILDGRRQIIDYFKL